VTALIDLYHVDHQSLVRWICDTYGIGVNVNLTFNNPHKVRRQNIAERLMLYRDKARIPVERIIDQVYDDDTNKKDLKRFIDAAKEQNVTARIVNEVANLYDRPAVRTLPDETKNAAFQVEQKRIKLPFFMQEGHRLTNLCNEVLLWQFTGVEDKRTLRLITPDKFDAIPDTRDELVPAGFLLDAPRASAMPKDHTDKLPAFEVWDDTYRYLINQLGQIVDETGEVVTVPIEHKLGRIPGVLFHRREPTTCILDGDSGEDIKSAHLGVGLLNVLIMRLSKSQGENHPVLKGNLAAVAANQTLHPERPIALPPGVTLEILQMVTDPKHYLDVKRDKLASVGARYGLSYESFMLELGNVATGKSLQISREKLTELRMEQRERARAHEELAVTLIGFDPTGMRNDFQEQAAPLDAQEEVDLLDSKMRKGLDSPIDYLMRKDPDLSRKDASTLLQKNLADFAILIAMVRALNIPASGDAANPGTSAQQNGAANQPANANAQPPPDNMDRTLSPDLTASDRRALEL
jgi:hypothetical protein